jgi:phosphoglycolate phosphatase
MSTRSASLYLFDIDGTLIGGDGAGRRAFEQALFDVVQLSSALEGIRLGGMTDPLILHEAFDRSLGRAPTGEEQTAIFACYARHLAMELATSEYHVKPGVEGLLDELQAEGATVGLATGNLIETAQIKLERGQLCKRFAFGGFGSDSAERAELVRVAIARGRVHARRDFSSTEVVVVGDTPRDIAAAHAAGARAVAVATGSYSVDELEAAGADEAYPTLESLCAVVT